MLTVTLDKLQDEKPLKAKKPVKVQKAAKIAKVKTKKPKNGVDVEVKIITLGDKGVGK